MVLEIKDRIEPPLSEQLIDNAENYFIEGQIAKVLLYMS